MESINVSEAKRRFSEYLSRTSAGERFMILRRERPVAVLVNPEELERLERTNNTARQLALALGQQSDLLLEIEKGETHPIMAAFGLWRDEDDLNGLADQILKNRKKQPKREINL